MYNVLERCKSWNTEFNRYIFVQVLDIFFVLFINEVTNTHKKLSGQGVQLTMCKSDYFPKWDAVNYIELINKFIEHLQLNKKKMLENGNEAVSSVFRLNTKFEKL